MKIRTGILLLVSVIYLSGCEQPVDPVIQSVNEVNSILQQYDWHVEDFIVELKDDDIPPPILWSTSDPVTKSGIYDMDDMIFDASDMLKTVHKFTAQRDIVSVTDNVNLLADSIGRYFVLNDRSIRITNSREKLIYRYSYDRNINHIYLTVNAETASKLIEDINQKMVDYIAKETPNKLGDAVAKILYNNEAIQKIINDALVSWISGKADFLNEIDPDLAARELAEKIINAINSIDWENELTALLKAELDKITNIDAELVSAQISQKIAEAINNSLSVDNIYSLLVPFMERLVANPESSAELISSLIVDLFFNIFDQDRLQPIVSDAWRKFALMDQEKVVAISDTLTGIVEDLWINEENLSALLLPFTQKIDETSILKMGELAQQATDGIKVIVDQINITFPDLNLDPDYTQMTSTLKAAFIAAKPVIGLVGGPEKAADEAAGLIINNFLNSEVISGGFVSAINYLQKLDPDIVGSKIASWLVNLEQLIAPELINYLTQLFSPILQNLNPEFTAFKIAQALNGFIKEKVTQESINELIYPLIYAFTQINTEEVANYIAIKILELDLIKDNINVDKIAEVLLPVMQNLQEADIPMLSQKLITAIVNSGIFEEVITEERVSAIIALLLYNSAWENAQIANNFKEATIILTHE
jgi:hypothetical protein